MSKILKPYTIIPQDLYVQRDADKQVKNIINDMGRPGYVLVSRQMGKTNLLLNAKRNFEIDNNVFVYVDLSNSFDNAKSCFENIIDVAIDSNYEKFEEVSKKIFKNRKEQIEATPHKQHNYELRLLLQALNGGKIVIMLDEIDALTKTNYSDQIFSQIRSSYFASRVNYKEFFNLTYLLSGVIEPNEIIKDSKISPFNIGQKIYLDDFSKEEFKSFIRTAELHLTIDLEDRIYYWTNGNPRMTWDICAEIENHLLNGSISISTIDKIVNELYLTTFDKPPIDNIRELVKEDSEIRNSIIEIEYKKGGEVSDRIKSKLYLAGIINYNEKNIHIKNEILRQSLSLEWIKSLEEEEKGLVKIAIDYFEKENYLESLQNFEKYLSTNTFKEIDKSSNYYYMGTAAYSINLFDKTIEYLKQTSFDKIDESRSYYSAINLIGLSNLYKDNIDESLACFKEVIESDRKDEIFAIALVNYGSISLKSDIKKYKDEAEIIFKNIINETGFDKEKIDINRINELKSISHYNLGKIYSSSNDKINALKQYELAIEYSAEAKKSKMLLELLTVLENENDKIKRIDELIDLIIKNKIKPVNDDYEKPFSFNYLDLKNLLILIYLDYNELFLEKSKPLFKLLDDKQLSVQLFELAIHLINNKNIESGKKLLYDLYENFSNEEFGIENEIKYKTLKILAYLYEDELKTKSIEYCSLFKSERFESVDNIDFNIFAELIYHFFETKKYRDALNYVDIINSVKSEVDNSYLANYLVIYNLEMNLNHLLNNREKVVEKAKEIIRLVNDDDIKRQKSNLLGETGLEIIKQNAESILRPEALIQSPISVSRKYGRNEIIKVKYKKNGAIIEAKFKKLQKDINNNECFILN